MKLRGKAKIFFWIYTLSDIGMAFVSFLLVLSAVDTAPEDNPLFSVNNILSWIVGGIFLLYMIYRIFVLYQDAPKKTLWQVIGIVLVVLFILNNTPLSFAILSSIVSILSLVCWIYDVKLIFLSKDAQ